MSPSPPSFPSPPSRWLLHLHPPRSCQSLSLCSHHATVTGIWFPSPSPSFLFFLSVCVWAATFSPVSSAVWGLRTSVKKLCAALFPVCERGVGGSSKPTERRDENKIKWKKKIKPHIVQPRLRPISLHWNVSYSIHIFISQPWCVSLYRLHFTAQHPHFNYPLLHPSLLRL